MWRGEGARRVGVIIAALIVSVWAAHRGAAFVTFETGQVRPLALSPDGHTLLALNTPDDRLEIFAVGGGDVVARRLGAGRARAGGGRGAHQH